ncbi:hypothetical protein H8959_019260 [Pygathrix nigripes]
MCAHVYTLREAHLCTQTHVTLPGSDASSSHDGSLPTTLTQPTCQGITEGLSPSQETPPREGRGGEAPLPRAGLNPREPMSTSSLSAL